MKDTRQTSERKQLASRYRRKAIEARLKQGKVQCQTNNIWHVNLVRNDLKEGSVISFFRGKLLRERQIYWHQRQTHRQTELN